MSGWAIYLSLMAGTFISEDAACIAAGLLIGQMSLDPALGILACFAGIYLGDLGLWSLGRWGRTQFHRLPPLAHQAESGQLQKIGSWFDRSAVWAIGLSRVTPGTRLPLYLAAGALGRKAGRFVLLTLIAAALWTPLLVLTAAWLGETLVRQFRGIVGGIAPAILAAAALLYFTLSLARKLSRWESRVMLRASIRKIWNWEFWPGWIFYPPVGLWVTALAVRYRRIGIIATVNPGIPLSGIVGESKIAILRNLAGPGVLRAGLIPAGPLDKRVERLRQIMAESRVNWPVILKPDAGQRGASVKKAHDESQAGEYLREHRRPVVVQEYHAGPFEAGIFYYRYPGRDKGRIFSITDKRFSYLTGDGLRTLRQLILHHPRYSMQHATFFKRHSDRLDRIPAAGERIRLAEAGNHCQGTMFLEGRRLWTPELEAAIDRIARRFEGFYFGRFDVRYSDEAAFRAGRDLNIVELNGVTSESTDIYDPRRSLISAWITLMRQWSIAFRIGHLNVENGHQPATIAGLWREMRRYYSERDRDLMSD